MDRQTDGTEHDNIPLANLGRGVKSSQLLTISLR